MNGTRCTITNCLSPRDYAIKQFRMIHGDKYDYSKFNYINGHTNVIIICQIHGEFEQLPSNHLSGKGCIKCSYEKRGLNSRETYESFSEKSNLIHGNYYDYSLVEYETCKENR